MLHQVYPIKNPGHQPGETGFTNGAICEILALEA